MKLENEILQKIHNQKYTISKTGLGERITQSQAIELKNDVQKLIIDTLVDIFDFDTYISDKGVILELSNEDLGGIFVELQVVTKPLDIDVVSLQEDVLAEREAKRKKKEAIAKDKEKKINKK